MSNYSSAHFFKPTPYNNDTKNQIWMSMIADGHDCICNCTSPFGHLLASIFPPGHQDRFLTIEEIINRDIKECLSGGEDARNSGMAGGEGPATTDIKAEEDEEENLPEEEIERLIAAAENATTR